MLFRSAPSAELLGWDVTALGLPEAQQPFVAGQFQQHLEVPGVWLERGLIDASDTLLLDSPIGLSGQKCLGTLFFVAGTALDRHRRDAALDAVRACLAQHPLAAQCGATSPHPQVLVVRVLGPLVEPVMDLLRQLWACWRELLWQLPGHAPRIWAM